MIEVPREFERPVEVVLRVIEAQHAGKIVARQDVADGADLFAGVVYKLPDLAQLEPALGSDLNQLEQRVTAIRQKVNLTSPAELVPDLTAALQQLGQIRSRATNEHARFLLERKEADFQEALRLAAGLVLIRATRGDER